MIYPQNYQHTSDGRHLFDLAGAACVLNRPGRAATRTGRAAPRGYYVATSSARHMSSTTATDAADVAGTLARLVYLDADMRRLDR